MEPWVNVTDPRFGAKGDGRTPDDRAIQAALNPDAIDPPGEHSVIVPPGTYRCDARLNVFYQLHLVQGAILKRTTDTHNTDPVVFLSNQGTSLVGGGVVATANDAPRGVVCVGPSDLGRRQNMGFTRINGIQIAGPASYLDSVGLNLDSLGQPGVNYAGRFSDLFIQGVGVGVKVGKFCKGHIFYNIQLYEMLQAGFMSLDNTENTFLGAFAQKSPNTTAIKLERVGYNLFYGVQAELGLPDPGKKSRFFEDDADCSVCQVLGHDNNQDGPVKNSPTLTYLKCSLFCGLLSLVSFTEACKDLRGLNVTKRLVDNNGRCRKPPIQVYQERMALR